MRNKTVLALFASLSAIMLIVIIVLLALDIHPASTSTVESLVFIIVVPPNSPEAMARLQIQQITKNARHRKKHDWMCVITHPEAAFDTEEQSSSIVVLTSTLAKYPMKIVAGLLDGSFALPRQASHFLMLANAYVPTKPFDARKLFCRPGKKHRFAGLITPDLDLIHVKTSNPRQYVPPLCVLPLRLMGDNDRPQTTETDVLSLIVDDVFDTWPLIFYEKLLHQPLTIKTLLSHQDAYFVDVMSTRDLLTRNGVATLDLLIRQLHEQLTSAVR